MTKDRLDELRGRMGMTTDNLQEKEARNALNQLAQQQAFQNQMTGYTEPMPEYAKGKSGIPKSGIMSNIIPNAIGGLMSAYQYFDAKNQDIKSPDIYSENPYASTALRNMANISINPYATMREMYGSERRNKYALERTGGLTKGQKVAAQVAAGIGTQENIGKMLNSIQAQNNQYKAAYNQALLNAGEGVASRRMTANQFREDMTAKAHAMRMQQEQMGMRNFMDYINNFAANEYKRTQGNAMLDLYQQSLDLDKAQLEALIRGWNLDNKPETVSTTRYIPQISIPAYTSTSAGKLAGPNQFDDITLSMPQDTFFMNRFKKKNYWL